MRVIRKVRDEGMALRLTEQSCGTALELGDRYYVMSKGQICFIGTRAKLDADTETMDRHLAVANREGNAMSNFVRACSALDLEPGTMRAFVVNGVRVAIYNVDGVFYATDDTCTHARASLSEGFLDGPMVECPLHQGTFDVRTGQPTAPPCTVAIRTYEVRVQDSEIFLRPSQPAG